MFGGGQGIFPLTNPYLIISPAEANTYITYTYEVYRGGRNGHSEGEKTIQYFCTPFKTNNFYVKY